MNNRNLCDKRLINYRRPLNCSNCRRDFHYKCQKLSKRDSEIILDSENQNFWTCSNCIEDLFPLIDDDNVISTDINIIDTIKNTNCHCCQKILGKKYNKCHTCDKLVHKRCLLGNIGCKNCARETLPGYELSTYTEIFNPYDHNSEINNICSNPNSNDEMTETWNNISNILVNCNYIELSNINSSRNSEFKVLCLNIQSLKSNFYKIVDNIDDYKKFDALCFNETSCDPDNLPFGTNELKLEGFHDPVVQKPTRTSTRGGGLAIYVNKNLCPESSIKVLNDLSSADDGKLGEFLFVEIDMGKTAKNIILGNVYRSPSYPPGGYIDELTKKLDKLTKHKNKHIMVTGDNNVDLLSHETYEPAQNLVNIFSQNGFVQVISRPTRITNHTATLIDHIFVNSPHSITKSGVITNPVADHLAPYVTLLTNSNKPNHRNMSFNQSNARKISDENLDKFKKAIENTDWSEINLIEDAIGKYTTFQKIYTKIYNDSFTKFDSKIKSQRNTTKPWILPWLQSACDRKNKLYHNYVKCPSTENKTKYDKMKRFVEKHIKRLKYKYYTDYFRKYANDSRKQWKMINSLLNRKKPNTNIGKIILDDDNSSEITSPGEISNAFNDYFCGIAKKMKDNSTHTVNPHTPKFRDKRVENSIFLSDCTKTEIEDIVNSLKNKATSDTAVVALKYVSASISSILSAIINASFLQGVFPEELKLAKVIPIHKTGKKTNVSNYRPISLLSVFSKIYEKTMHKRLYDFFSRNETIYKHQYGFRKQHSCEHALLEAQYTLTKALDNKQISALLLIDFSKAFDMVDHNTLAYKLEHYGIRGHALNWLKSYLDNRRQYVSVNGHNSRTGDLSCGVPQGSILGPLLFVIFINDLPFIDNLAKFILYADDANIIFTGQSIEIIEMNMRNFISKLEEWVALNGLKLNISKTKYMLFSNRNTRDINVEISATSIERKKTERFLGVIIDDRLTFKQHRATLASKIARNAGVIYKVKGIVPLHVIKTLYNSFIQSHLVYCSNVWGLG